MNDNMLASRPGISDYRRIARVARLLEHVELTGHVCTSMRVEVVEKEFMTVDNIANVKNPVVSKADSSTSQSRMDTSATEMTDYHDVLHFQNVDRVLQACKAVQVRWRDNVRNIPVNEEFPGAKSNQLVGGDPAVCTPYPEILRRLLMAQSPEESRLGSFNRIGPTPVLPQ
ncbi:hypothetical protein A9R05_21615 [Burkholderia sp. KK1]|nr:hypothetical protein A9R05_21615 [Burkholderia sp. KK1]